MQGIILTAVAARRRRAQTARFQVQHARATMDTLVAESGRAEQHTLPAARPRVITVSLVVHHVRAIMVTVEEVIGRAGLPIQRATKLHVTME